MHVRVNPAFVRESEVVKLCGDNKKLKEIINDWKDIDLKETLQWMLQN
jgi:GDP-D-mannose dehydratase